ncbi:MAG: hypothetical protein JNG89_01055 [Planctomycetaceae bacterium]|nr:hypothetical protein [Planctomycetaceae bacterium]
MPTVSVTAGQVLDDAAWVASVDEFFATDLLDRRVSRPAVNQADVAQRSGRTARRRSARPSTLDATSSNPASPVSPAPAAAND